MTSKHFDAILAKNSLAEILAGIQKGEYADLSELPLRQMVFDLQEIEAYSGQGNQPGLSDILNLEFIA